MAYRAFVPISPAWLDPKLLRMGTNPGLSALLRKYPCSRVPHHERFYKCQHPMNAFVSAAVKQAFHIEQIFPSVDCGRFAVKRIVGETIEVWADIYRDGHEVVAAEVIWRGESEAEWHRAAMTPHGNDRWSGSFAPGTTGRFTYAIEAWTDEFATWRHGFQLKLKADVATELDAMEGASLLTHALNGDQETTAKIARACETFLQSGAYEILLAEDLKKAMSDGQPRRERSRSMTLKLLVER